MAVCLPESVSDINRDKLRRAATRARLAAFDIAVVDRPMTSSERAGASRGLDAGPSQVAGVDAPGESFRARFLSLVGAADAGWTATVHPQFLRLTWKARALSVRLEPRDRAGSCYSHTRDFNVTYEGSRPLDDAQRTALASLLRAIARAERQVPEAAAWFATRPSRPGVP